MSGEVLLVILFALFGFLLGALLTTLLINRGRKASDTEGDFPQGLDADHHRSLARLWREKESGSLLVETPTQIAGSEAELTEKERQEMLALGKEWLRWLSGPLSAVEPAPAAAQPVREAAPEIPPVATQPAVLGTGPLNPQRVVPVSAPPPPVPAVTGTGPLNPQRVVTGTGPLNPSRTVTGTGPLRTLDGLPGDKKNTPLTPSRSIVQQVDDILQERLRNTPLNERGIRLTQDLRDGVVIWVGLERFVGLDSVPYPEVTEAVRGAVKEWEETTGQ